MDFWVVQLILKLFLNLLIILLILINKWSCLKMNDCWSNNSGLTEGFKVLVCIDCLFLQEETASTCQLGSRTQQMKPDWWELLLLLHFLLLPSSSDGWLHVFVSALRSDPRWSCTLYCATPEPPKMSSPWRRWQTSAAKYSVDPRKIQYIPKPAVNLRKN